MGGILITTKHYIPNRLIHVDSNFDILWVSISISFSKVPVGVCYRPPDADVTFANELSKFYYSR